MHAKTDSEVTSLAASSPPRSPPRRPIYYVMSPTHSHHDTDRVSLGGSSPGASPLHPHYHHPHHHRYASSPIHHSRESSTTRLSGSLKYASSSWRKLHSHPHGAGAHHPGAPSSSACSDSDVDDDDDDGPIPVRCYVAWFVLGFVLLFTLFSLILWGASKSYKPDILVKVSQLARVNSEFKSQLVSLSFTLLLSLSLYCAGHGVPDIRHSRGNGPHGRAHQDALPQLDGQDRVPQPGHLLRRPRLLHPTRLILLRPQDRLRICKPLRIPYPSSHLLNRIRAKSQSPRRGSSIARDVLGKDGP